MCKARAEWFGNILSDSDENLTIPFGFAGGLHDRDINLIRFGFRDYDPYIGKWTARDPILFEGGSSNLYGYIDSDPINFIDPEGLAGGYTKVKQYKISNKVDSNHGAQKHVHWGENSSRENAVNKDGTPRHKNDKSPPKKVKDTINKMFGWSLKNFLLLPIPNDALENFLEEDLDGNGEIPGCET